MRRALVAILALCLFAITLPSAQATSIGVSTPEWPSMTTLGAMYGHGDATDVQVRVRGSTATVVVDAAGARIVDSFPVTWTKEHLGKRGELWGVHVSGQSEAFGAVSLRGVWQAVASHGICTMDYPTSYCQMYAEGPVELVGSMGGKRMAVAGLMLDTYCMRGHGMLNEMTVCGDAPLLPDPGRVCLACLFESGT